MKEIVLLSGHTTTGKSSLARLLSEEFGHRIISSSGFLRQEALSRGLATDRFTLQTLGDQLGEETRQKWLLEHVSQIVRKIDESQSIVVDNVRTWEQMEQFRKAFNMQAVHVHLYVPRQELRTRLRKKYGKTALGESDSEESIDLIKSEEYIDKFKNDADVRINTHRTDAKDNLVRIAARLGLYSPPDIRMVDVLVGGQYGSEGKGHVAAYLAREYDILIRVGGPNAGHTVSSETGIFTYHHLPSGARYTQAKLLLGPGMTINVDKLLREISECNIGPERLFIDPQAMVISQDDIANEEELRQNIGSTKSGSGFASTRRIMQRTEETKLARDIPKLQAYVGEPPNYRGSIKRHLEQAYSEGESVLLEGTQGSSLSIFHGIYPYVTSRDTNVAGCLAEAGISPSRVRRILMVIRPTPIRVGDPEGGKDATSGPLKHPVTFDIIAEEAGLNADEVNKSEKTSTTGRNRKVGWFEWEQFRDACQINAPTDIVLTFADYLSAKNSEARRFEQLEENTIKFVEELERVAHAPVSLINVRFPRDESEAFDLRTVIDRRNWISQRRKRR